MLIFDGESQPIILDSINGPTVSEYMWVLDLTQKDFMLAELTMLEEVVCPSIQLMVRGFQFILPANWNILVYDRDTAQLDVVELADAAGREFTAMAYGPTKTKPDPALITVTNYFVEYKNIGPSLFKHQMLCHPVGPDEWVCVSPSDTYNKYLKDIIVGDLIGY
jgi:hypothetical protein